MSGQADSDLPLQLSTIPNKPTCHVPKNKAGSAGQIREVLDVCRVCCQCMFLAQVVVAETCAFHNPSEPFKTF